MVTFTVGTKEKAFRFWDRLQLVVRAASLGGTETLTSLPILFSHTGYSAEELRRAGVDEGMVRMSVGLEDPGRPDRRSRAGARVSAYLFARGVVQQGGGTSSAAGVKALRRRSGGGITLPCRAPATAKRSSRQRLRASATGPMSRRGARDRCRAR